MTAAELREIRERAERNRPLFDAVNYEPVTLRLLDEIERLRADAEHMAGKLMVCYQDSGCQRHGCESDEVAQGYTALVATTTQRESAGGE